MRQIAAAHRPPTTGTTSRNQASISAAANQRTSAAVTAAPFTRRASSVVKSNAGRENVWSRRVVGSVTYVPPEARARRDAPPTWRFSTDRQRRGHCRSLVRGWSPVPGGERMRHASSERLSHGAPPTPRPPCAPRPPRGRACGRGSSHGGDLLLPLVRKRRPRRRIPALGAERPPAAARPRVTLLPGPGPVLERRPQGAPGADARHRARRRPAGRRLVVGVGLDRGRAPADGAPGGEGTGPRRRRPP